MKHSIIEILGFLKSKGRILIVFRSLYLCHTFRIIQTRAEDVLPL